MAVEVSTAGREFARRFNNILPELQLQPGIHRRIEDLLEDWGAEHPNLRATYLGREVDSAYFRGLESAADAIARPSLQGLAIEGEVLFEFVAFAHGLRRDVVELGSIVHLQETWIEVKSEEPFSYRVELRHAFGATTVLIAARGESQDAAQEFVGRFKYLRGW